MSSLGGHPERTVQAAISSDEKMTRYFVSIQGLFRATDFDALVRSLICAHRTGQHPEEQARKGVTPHETINIDSFGTS
jgi:hypothetical protein